MTSPHPTGHDLAASLARFDTEATPGVFDTGRYRCRFVAWGDGRPLVFVHGMADRARSFAMVMGRLVDAGYRCVAYELANGLDDGANLGMYRHPQFVADLVALLDHLGLSQVDLLGSSFGTTIAIRTLHEHPHRVRRCVLKGGFARRPLRRFERGLSRLGRYWPWRMADLPFRTRKMLELEGRGFVGVDPAVFAFLQECTGVTPCRAAALRTLLIDTLDLRPLLPAIPHPVLMVGGDVDGIVPRWCEAEVEAGLRNVRRVELSPCGHYPQYTMPGPLAELVAGFLN